MTDGVLVMVDGRMKVLQRAGQHDDEMVLTMLEHRPDLVVGAATGGDHRRLLLVSRPASGSSTTGAECGSLERLYVDSDAVPVLVDVHTAAHPWAAGEALLRLLDRVALHLPHSAGGRLRDLARVTHGDRSDAELLVQALGWRADPDTFWARAESNLAKLRARIVLVADRLPDELVRVVELLDEQLRDLEIRSVELCLYGSGPVRALLPRVTSLTAPRRSPKLAAEPPQPSERATRPDLDAHERVSLPELLNPERRDGAAPPGRHRRRD
jgi:hypothetical protein